MNIWIASHECSGIAEAGGVKNVTFSLCKELYRAGNNSVLFIPVFHCTSFCEVKGMQRNVVETKIEVCGKDETIAYTLAFSKSWNFKIVFVEHPSFAEKEAVYTYTQNEEKKNSSHKKGCGHEDALFLDTLFAKAVTEFGKHVSDDEKPDIIHCQDASTATIPLYVNNCEKLSKAKTVVTIHNAGPAYHHNFTSSEEAAWYTGYDIKTFENCLNRGKPEPFLIACEYGALLSTVSPSYAEELTDPKNDDITDGLSSIFHEKNIPVSGIINGIDIDLYEPGDSNKSGLPFEFSPEKGDFQGKNQCRKFFLEHLKSNEQDPDDSVLSDIKKYGFLLEYENAKTVYLCYQGRLASQKGLSVFADALPSVLENFPNLKVIITGQGESALEGRFVALSENEKFKGQIVFLNGYNRLAARLTVASSDFICLPSFFEPCGLEDFIAQVYGTLPVAHRTGGLNKIVDGKTGFLYETNKVENLISKLSEIISIKMYSKDTIIDMATDAAKYTRQEYNWDKVAQNAYIPLFGNLIK
ncbi:MAG: glycogen/starch synthase [Treponema sp.]|nr:glycogen/starch synthase [Treponema sp.]